MLYKWSNQKSNISLTAVLSTLCRLDARGNPRSPVNSGERVRI